MFQNAAKKTKGRVASRFLAALCAFTFVGMPTAQADGDAELSVAVSRVRNSHGTVFVAVYERGSWLKPGRYRAAQRVKAHAGTVVASFRGLSRGEYGVAVWHDENANNRVDTNFVGLPTEGYGFSRITPMRRPSFDEAAVAAVPRGHAPIRLRY